MNADQAGDNPLALLGERVERRRTDKRLRQSELIERMRGTRFRPKVTAQSLISNIEGGRGENLPSVPALAALAEALDTSLDYLVGLSDNPSPSREGAHRITLDAADEDERALLQELFDLIHARPREEQHFIAAVVRRLAAPPGPRQPIIIGKRK